MRTRRLEGYCQALLSTSAAILVAVVACSFCLAGQGSGAEDGVAAGSGSGQVVPDPLQDLDAYVAYAMEEWGVPGVSVAVVQGNRTILARGYGVRDTKKGGEVDGRTLFPIASVTKVFTAMGMGILVSDGKVQWDDPLVKHMPDFKVADPYFTQHLTVRDALSHRTGMGAHFGDRYVMPLHMRGECTREVILGMLPSIPPQHSFRSGYNYTNVFYLVAGEVIGRVAGASWSAFLQERLFKPLGMSRSRTGIAETKGMENIVSPHGLDPEGEMAPIPMMDGRCIDAAVAILSSAEDMARFVLLQLALGEVGGKRIVAAKVMEELATSQAVMAVTDFKRKEFGTNFAASGLGWEMIDYHGVKLVRASGLAPGSQAYVMLAPAEGLGIVVMTNSWTTLLHVSVAMRILDRYLGRPDKDWVKVLRTAMPRIPERQAIDVAPEVLADFVGSYATSDGEKRTFFMQDGKLYVDCGGIPGGPPEPPARLFPEAEGLFFLKTADVRFRFGRDGDGKLSQCTGLFGPTEVKFEKAEEGKRE